MESLLQQDQEHHAILKQFVSIFSKFILKTAHRQNYVMKHYEVDMLQKLASTLTIILAVGTF